MGPFPPSEGKEYILEAMNYVSKWIESIPKRTNDHRVVNKFIVSNIFSRLGCLREIVSDGGFHFTNSYFQALLGNMEFTIALRPRITPKQVAK